MKRSKTFRLSEEACAVIEKQDNATEYLESLVLGTQKGTPTSATASKVSPDRLTEGRVLYLITQETASLQEQIDELQKMRASAPQKTSDELLEEMTAPKKLPCCLGKSPCRHWMHDGDSGAWINSITGELRDE